MIEHFYNPEKFGEEILRVLKPGGLAIIMCPAWEYNMKMFFDDSATFLFAEGDRFNSVNGFIDHIKNQKGDDDANWTYDWAVAVDESPGEGGEWVNAGFTSDISKTNEDTSKIHYSEWYYIEDGKIKLWNQTRRIILSK